MTIEELGNYEDTHGIADGARCIWFDNKAIKQRVFDVATLEIFTGSDHFRSGDACRPDNSNHGAEALTRALYCRHDHQETRSDPATAA